jgi:hypothetical protein
MIFRKYLEFKISIDNLYDNAQEYYYYDFDYFDNNTIFNSMSSMNLICIKAKNSYDASLIFTFLISIIDGNMDYIKSIFYNEIMSEIYQPNEYNPYDIDDKLFDDKIITWEEFFNIIEESEYKRITESSRSDKIIKPLNDIINIGSQYLILNEIPKFDIDEIYNMTHNELIVENFKDDYLRLQLIFEKYIE